MYAKLYRKCIFPFYETVLRGRKTLSYLEEIERDQWLSEAEIEAVQWRKLKKLLDHAYENVPYYRKKFDEAGISPERIKTRKDFVKLPILTREDIRANQKELIARNFRNEELISKTTSGSSGVPLEFNYDRNAYEWHMVALARSNRWAGWDYGEKELYIWGSPPYKIGRYKKIKETIHHLFLRRKRINTFSLSVSNLTDKVREINRFKPKTIIGYTSSIYELARFIKSSGIQCHAPKSIITTAEKLFPSQREVIESAFDAKIFDRYGCQEAMFIAGECHKHEGLHMNTDNLLIEIIKDGKTATYGEAGDVIITDLNNYSMPFIRYKNGDMASLSNRKCSCGRGLPLLEKIDGRKIDTIVTSEGRMVSGEVFLYIIDRFAWVKKYKVIQTEKDSFLVLIVKESDRKINEDLETIKDDIRKALGDKVDVRFEFVNQIPLEASGKNRIVVSNTAVDHCKSLDHPKNKIKVMHLLLSLEHGGAERVVINLIKKLQGNGINFSICTLDRMGALTEELSCGVEAECMDRKKGLDFSLPFRLAKAIRRSAPNIIHMHNSTSILYGALAGRLAGVNKMISTQHGMVSAETEKMRLAIGFISRLLSKHVAVSNDVAVDLQNSYKIKNGGLSTIINGIDENLYKRDEAKRIDGRKKLGLTDEVVFGNVARLSPEKDQETLLRAYAQVIKRSAKTKLIIVGDGPLKEHLKDVAKNLNISDKVIFVGSQMDIPYYLNIFDIFTLSSIREGTSLTLLEAMSAGLPVVATTVGGNTYVVDENTGILIPAQNPDRLAEAMVYLVDNPAKRRAMGISARKKIEGSFTLTAMAEKYKKLYREIAS
jgi:phenylacetate-CoA ligase